MKLRIEMKLRRILLWINRLMGPTAMGSALEHHTDRTVRAQAVRRKRRQARFAAALSFQQAGLTPAEIARESRLPREIVTVLLDRSQPGADNSAGGGTFFRILHSRITDERTASEQS